MARRHNLVHGSPSDVHADSDYGGECRVLNVSTGTTHGPFWVDLEFGKDYSTASKAILEAPEWLGVEIAHSGGRVVLALDDGREFIGDAVTVLKRTIIFLL